MEYPPFEKVRAKLIDSLNFLFDKDKYLFKNNVNERSISHMLALYLKYQFKNWDVDCEYNKNHDNSKRIKNLNFELKEHEKNELIKDINGITVFPDIIIHHRGKKENLLVIEIKKSTSSVRRDNFDKKKLRGFCTDQKLKYRNAVFLKFKIEDDKVDLKEEKWICKDGKLEA